MIVAGSYEGGLHGWENNTLAFSFVAHTGCVRSVAINKKLLISGGDDEVIKIFNLKSRKQVGEAERQQGTITALAFCHSHALSGSGDGSICVWRDWECVHILGGHKAAVSCVAPHPSGRMALSTGDDRTLRLWDLVSGRSAFITRTRGTPRLCAWCDDGSKYLVVTGQKVDVKDTVEGTTESIDHDAVVLHALFLDLHLEHHVATADAAGAIRVWAPDGLCVWRRAREHVARVKALVVVASSSGPTGITAGDALDRWSDQRALVAATSDGALETWRLVNATAHDDPPAAQLTVNTRLTCLAESTNRPNPHFPAPAVAPPAAQAPRRRQKDAKSADKKALLHKKLKTRRRK